jgi:hypothetical protein
MDRLNQQKLFVKKEFILGEKGLTVNYRNLIRSSTLEIPYEDIGSQRLHKKTNGSRQLRFAVFMLAASGAKAYYLFAGEHDDYVFTIVVLGIFLISCLMTYYAYNELSVIECTTHADIRFYTKRPDEQTVDNFILALQTKTKAFLVRKYAELDATASERERLDLIDLLRRRKFITETEYEGLISKTAIPASK